MTNPIPPAYVETTPVQGKSNSYLQDVVFGKFAHKFYHSLGKPAGLFFDFMSNAYRSQKVESESPMRDRFIHVGVNVSLAEVLAKFLPQRLPAYIAITSVHVIADVSRAVEPSDNQIVPFKPQFSLLKEEQPPSSESTILSSIIALSRVKMKVAQLPSDILSTVQHGMQTLTSGVSDVVGFTDKNIKYCVQTTLEYFSAAKNNLNSNQAVLLNHSEQSDLMVRDNLQSCLSENIDPFSDRMLYLPSNERPKIQQNAGQLYKSISYLFERFRRKKESKSNGEITDKNHSQKRIEKLVSVRHQSITTIKRNRQIVYLNPPRKDTQKSPSVNNRKITISDPIVRHQLSISSPNGTKKQKNISQQKSDRQLKTMVNDDLSMNQLTLKKKRTRNIAILKPEKY